MSKASTATAEQQYTDKVVPATCANCKSCVAVMGDRLMYVDPHNSMAGTHKVPVQTGQKCGIGDFAVKKLGWCKLHVLAEATLPA
jgi:hypothetical protein